MASTSYRFSGSRNPNLPKLTNVRKSDMAEIYDGGQNGS